MTIDERLEALTRSLELLTSFDRDLELKREQDRIQFARLDARERRAREALLTGISAYLKSLEEQEGE